MRFAQRPPVDKVRAALAGKLPVEVTEVTTGSQDDIIGTDVKDDRALQAARQTIVDSLTSAFGASHARQIQHQHWRARLHWPTGLRDPLQRAGVALSEPQLQDLAKNIVSFRERRRARG